MLIMIEDVIKKNMQLHLLREVWQLHEGKVKNTASNITKHS